jgi:hypothetical protein
MIGTGFRRLAVAVGILAAAPAMASGFAAPVSSIQALLLGATANITVSARSTGGGASGRVVASVGTPTTPAIACNTGSTLNCVGAVTIPGSVTLTYENLGATTNPPAWVGCNSVVAGNCVISMTAARSITANFSPSSYALTVRPVATVGAAGTVSVAVTPQVNCTTAQASCVAQIPTGTTVAVTAAPELGSVFTGWTGACTGTGACSVLGNAVKSVTANFGRATYTVSVGFYGGNGTVTSTGGVAPDLSCASPGTGTCSGQLAPTGTMLLTATPSAMSDFTGWTGCTSVAGAVCTVEPRRQPAVDRRVPVQGL